MNKGASHAQDLQERILILAPVGRDASLTCELLQQAGLRAEACADLDALSRQLREGAGVACLAEEALPPPMLSRFVRLLEKQPPWSALPLIVLTHRRTVTSTDLHILAIPKALRHATFLERPIRIITLISAVQAALEARRRQYQVKNLLEQLEENISQRDQFLAMLGHELRNPLAAAGNALELLKLLGVEHPVLDKALDILERQMGHLIHMLDDLLDVSRITRGKIQLRKEIVTLESVVNDALGGARELIQQRGHTLEISLPSEALWLEADPTRLRQILINLLHNAAKYTEAQGHIWLTATADGNWAEVRVRDNGTGMTPKMLSRVFDLFAQSERTLDRSQGGLGIGLTLTRRLVELHGGNITASSPGLGQGSEFVVRLPLAPQNTVSALTASLPTADNRERPLRILVVDDNQDLVQGLSALLRESGHRVDVAFNGDEGLRLARDCRPQVILLDIGLPGLDGFEVARRLRTDSALADTMLIALTGYGSENDRRRSWEAGFDRHLIKPVKFETLRQLLADVSL